MYKRSTLYVLAALLLAEAVAVVLIPSRIPRGARGVTAGINVVAAVAVALIARQKK
jgi:hypothetical protein